MNTDTNIVKNHAEFFGTPEGDLTNESMEHGHKCQYINKNIGLKKRAIKNMLTERNKPHSVEGVCSLVNPARTGIWNTDGSFNSYVFNEITSKALIVGDKKFVTKKIFMDYLIKKVKDKNIGNACKVFYVVPVNWTQVTDGSIDELFEYFADWIYKDEKVLTVERLRYFYTKPKELMQKRMKYFQGKIGDEIFV